jgi:amidohydrolase
MDFEKHPLYERLSELRRDFHSNPELPLQEHRTTKKIKEILTGLGVKLLPLDVETGAAGLIEGAFPGKTLGVRGDIDALPMQEKNDVPYRSKVDGVMHSCGHDCHNTVVLGLAQKLTESNLAAKMKGNVKLIFQPAEEIVAGAKAMIDAGVMENPKIDRAISCHMWTQLNVGEIGLYKSVSHAAADMFKLKIIGQGCHGAAPHNSIDPIVAGAHFVSAAQTLVSRNTSPLDTAVVTVGTFQAGTAPNIIPESAQLSGTVRTFTEEVRQMIIDRLGQLSKSLETGFGVKSEFEYIHGVPSCKSDREVADFMFEASAKVVGEKNVHWLEPQTGGEDFAFFSDLVPGTMIRLGCSNPDRDIVRVGHSPFFDVDEAVLPIGVEVFYQAVKDYLVD